MKAKMVNECMVIVMYEYVSVVCKLTCYVNEDSYTFHTISQ